MITVKCDCCKEPIITTRASHRICIKHTVCEDLRSRYEHDECSVDFDLCGDCYEKFKNYVNVVLIKEPFTDRLE